jgi:hypothetical protein
MGFEADPLWLRTALRDLVALSTVPAVWVGREPPAIAAGLVDVLVNSVSFDFAFVRLCDPNEGAAVDISRESVWQGFPEWLQQYLSVNGRLSTGNRVDPHRRAEEAVRESERQFPQKPATNSRPRVDRPALPPPVQTVCGAVGPTVRLSDRWRSPPAFGLGRSAQSGGGWGCRGWRDRQAGRRLNYHPCGSAIPTIIIVVQPPSHGTLSVRNEIVTSVGPELGIRDRCQGYSG